MAKLCAQDKRESVILSTICQEWVTRDLLYALQDALIMRGYLEDPWTDLPQHRVLHALRMFRKDNDLHLGVPYNDLHSVVLDYETLSRL